MNLFILLLLSMTHFFLTSCGVKGDPERPSPMPYPSIEEQTKQSIELERKKRWPQKTNGNTKENTKNREKSTVKEVTWN